MLAHLCFLIILTMLNHTCNFRYWYYPVLRYRHLCAMPLPVPVFVCHTADGTSICVPYRYRHQHIFSQLPGVPVAV